jgi:hypothetical protein
MGFCLFWALGILLSALSRGRSYVWRGFLFEEIGNFYGPNMSPLAGLMDLVRTGCYNHVAPLELNPALLCFHHQQITPLAQVGNPFMPSVHPIPAPLGAA